MGNLCEKMPKNGHKTVKLTLFGTSSWKFFTSYEKKLWCFSESWILGLQEILMMFDHSFESSGWKMPKCQNVWNSRNAMKRNHYINFDQRFLQKGCSKDFTFHGFPIPHSQGTSCHMPLGQDIFFLINIAVEKCELCVLLRGTGTRTRHRFLTKLGTVEPVPEKSGYPISLITAPLQE